MPTSREPDRKRFGAPVMRMREGCKARQIAGRDARRIRLPDRSIQGCWPSTSGGGRSRQARPFADQLPPVAYCSLAFDQMQICKPKLQVPIAHASAIWPRSKSAPGAASSTAERRSSARAPAERARRGRRSLALGSAALEHDRDRRIEHAVGKCLLAQYAPARRSARSTSGGSARATSKVICRLPAVVGRCRPNRRSCLRADRRRWRVLRQQALADGMLDGRGRDRARAPPTRARAIAAAIERAQQALVRSIALCPWNSRAGRRLRPRQIALACAIGYLEVSACRFASDRRPDCSTRLVATGRRTAEPGRDPPARRKLRASSLGYSDLEAGSGAHAASNLTRFAAFAHAHHGAPEPLADPVAAVACWQWTVERVPHSGVRCSNFAELRAMRGAGPALADGGAHASGGAGSPTPELNLPRELLVRGDRPPGDRSS